MPPASRITDMHTCPMVAPGPCPHVGGPIIRGSHRDLSASCQRAGSVTRRCAVVCRTRSAMGSPTVIIGNQMAARIGDPTRSRRCGRGRVSDGLNRQLRLRRRQPEPRGRGIQERSRKWHAAGLQRAL